MPALATGLVAFLFALPFLVLAVEAAREAHDLLAYLRQTEQIGISVPELFVRLPFGAEAVAV